MGWNNKRGIMTPIALIFIYCIVFLAFVNGQHPNRVGDLDLENLMPKISRGSGTGVIPFGFAIVAIAALVLCVFLILLIHFYKREQGIRNEEKTLFLTTY